VIFGLWEFFYIYWLLLAHHLMVKMIIKSLVM
jgi:hypothetical protein